MALETLSCSIRSAGACLRLCLTTNPQSNNQGSSGVYCHVHLLTERVPDKLLGFFWNKRESEQPRPYSLSHIPCSSLSYSSWTCLSTLVHPLRRLTDVLLFVLGFSLGEYGCVSRQKVLLSSKPLPPALVCKKVWAVCLLVSSSTCSQGTVGLDKSQLFLSIARYGMHHSLPLLFRTQHLWLQWYLQLQ